MAHAGKGWGELKSRMTEEHQLAKSAHFTLHHRDIQDIQEARQDDIFISLWNNPLKSSNILI